MYLREPHDRALSDVALLHHRTSYAFGFAFLPSSASVFSSVSFRASLLHIAMQLAAFLASQPLRCTLNWSSSPTHPALTTRRPLHSCASASLTKRVCRVCKQKFIPSENHSRACRHHTTMFSGRLLRVTPTETSDIGFFYDCCGATSMDAPGCTYAAHLTYDD